MNYYKVIYDVGANNERIYPPGIKEVAWNIAQYHFTENIMIGGTDSRVEADDENVKELSEDEALSLIDEFKKSYPEIPERKPSFSPERKTEAKSARTASPAKKRGSRR